MELAKEERHMKKLIATLIAIAIVGITVDKYTVDATLIDITNTDVLYEDSRGHIWAVERDLQATYRLDQEVTLEMAAKFNAIIEDDEIVNIYEK